MSAEMPCFRGRLTARSGHVICSRLPDSLPRHLLFTFVDAALIPHTQEKLAVYHLLFPQFSRRATGPIRQSADYSVLYEFL